MFEISLKTVDRLQLATMRLSAVTYLQQLFIEDTDGWLQKDDPERTTKDIAFDLLFSLQRDALHDLHNVVFGEDFS